MSQEEQNDHAWFRGCIAAYLAGGLETGDRLRFESHAASCTDCAAELAAVERMEQQMATLFAQPAAGFEDRIVRALREAPPRWSAPIQIHPAVRKAATGIAAAMLLAGFGYVAQNRILNGHGAAPAGFVLSDVNGRGAATEHLFRSEFRDPSHGIIAKELGNNAGTNVDTWGDNRRVHRADDLSGAGAANHAAQLSAENEWKDGNFGVQLSGSGQAGYPMTVAGGTLSLAKPPAQAAAGDDKKSVSNSALYYDDFTKTPADLDGDAANKNYFKPTQLSLAGNNAYYAGGKIDVTDGSVPTLGRRATLLNGSVAAINAVPSQNAGELLVTGLQGGLNAQAAAPTTPPVSATPVVQDVHEAQIAPTTQKVIRDGQMEFEVDRFDAAFAIVSKLTAEAKGYVGNSDSEKLPNGKVKGTVTVRVPPDRLDTLVLQLRGIGDLKSQKLDSNDVTKHYTDLESELRADRAMEERLLGIIKDGKGQIKDLLAAEKELGTWRGKIENIVGEMRYLDSQVAMSTLVITLYERDIKTPATATETESIDTGMEVSDVEKARTDALKAIEEAKGRVIQSDLKQFDAGQFGATIVADVPPDATGPMLDRLKQIGKLARFDIERKQTSDPNNDSNASAPQKVKKNDTRLNLSIYNLANVAPRTITTMNLAAEDVEKTYQAIRDRVIKAGGRIVASDFARNKAEKTTGTVTFDVPSAEADGVMNDLRAMGDVRHLTVTDNPDVNNVTTAKRGFALQLVATASIPPRETTTLTIAATKVGDAREKILAAASSGGARVLVSQLNESDPNDPSSTIELDVPRTTVGGVEKAIGDAGDTVSRNVTRSSDNENTLDTKVKLQITLRSADKLAPRETTSLTMETSDVDAAMAALQQSAQQAGAKILDSYESKERDGSTKATLVVDAPLDKSAALVDQAKQLGTVRAAQSTRNLQSPGGALAKARIELTLVTPDAIVQPGTGPWATIRNGLSTSVKALLWSLELIVIGACTVLPFAAVITIGWKLLKRRKTSAATP